MNRIGFDSYQYYPNWYIQTSGFPNGSVFITSQPQEQSCVRARRENALAQSSPCTAAKGMYLVGARKQELPGATLLGTLWM